MKPGPKAGDPVARFWAKVLRHGPDDCWVWTAGTAGSGYGQFYRVKAQPVGAHRYAWEIANGRPVPEGFLVMHSCDNPPCVNPAHLSIGTHTDNRIDCSLKGRNPGNRTARGRKQSTISGERLTTALQMVELGDTQRDIAKFFNVSPAAVCRALKANRQI